MISRDFILKIGKILIELGGADPKIIEDNSEFINHLLKSDHIEYRFMGYLGLGGKFRTPYCGWKVDCYQEDETPIRLKLIKEINNKLKELYDKYLTIKMYNESLHIDIDLLPSLSIRIDASSYKSVINQLHDIVKNLSQSKGTRHAAKFILAVYGEIPVGIGNDHSYNEEEDTWQLDREHLAAVNAIKFYHRKLKNPYI